MRRLTLLTSLVTLSVLSACGGGGGGGGGGPVSYAALNAWDNLFAATRTWTLLGTSQGHAVVLNTALRVQSAAVFPGTGATGNRRAFESDMLIDGVPAASGTTTYFLDGNNALMGATASDGTCVIVDQVALPPTTVTAGSSGQLATWDAYDSCAVGAFRLASGTYRWSVSTLGSQVYFCHITAGTYISGDTTRESDCFAIDGNGSIRADAVVTLQATVNGQSATLELSTL